MNILNDLQNKKQNKKKAKQGLDIIREAIKNKTYDLDKTMPTMPMLRVEGVLIATFKGKNWEFQGYFADYYDESIAHELEYAIKGKVPKAKGCKGSNNNGHKFESTVAYVLKNMGHKVKGIKAINYFPKINERLENIFKDLPKQKFEKLRDIKNAESLSSDFMNDTLGISCKYNNKVLKHPTLCKIFSFSNNKNREEILKEIEMFNTDKIYTKDKAREEFGADAKVALDLVRHIYPRLQTNNVKEVYDFLVGKERPWLLTMKENFEVELEKTETWGTPNEYSFELKKDKIYIHFNNGVSLRHRIKGAIGSKSKVELCKVYKEQWTLVNYPIK